MGDTRTPSDAAEVARMLAEINDRYGSDLTADDVEVIAGTWTVDGMVPDQWAEAMYGDVEVVATAAGCVAVMPGIGACGFMADLEKTNDGPRCGAHRRTDRAGK